MIWWLYAEAGESVWQQPMWFFIRCFVAAAICFPLFHMRMIGAGDIKLMALTCGFLGARDGFECIVYGFLLGAGLSLIKLLVQKSLFQRLNYFNAYVRRLIITKEVTAYYIPSRDGYAYTIPLGVCLFLGTLISIWMRW